MAKMSKPMAMPSADEMRRMQDRHQAEMAAMQKRHMKEVDRKMTGKRK